MYPRFIVPGALLALTACGGETTGPPEPTPGPLTVNLAAPSGAAGTGALVLTVTGPGPISGLAGAAGTYRVYSRELASGEGLKIVVFGTLSSGPLIRFNVPDTGESGEYVVTLGEVAGTDNAIKPAAGYGLTLSD